MKDFEIRSATVLAAEAGSLLVRVERKYDEDCGGCRSCAMKNLCGKRDAGHIDLRIAGGAGGIRVGDTVKVAYHSTNPAVAATLLFAPPLLGALLGAIVAWWARVGDAGFVLGCFLGLAAGIAATYATSRMVPSLRPAAHLVGAQAPKN